MQGFGVSVSLFLNAPFHAINQGCTREYGNSQHCFLKTSLILDFFQKKYDQSQPVGSENTSAKKIDRRHCRIIEGSRPDLLSTLNATFHIFDWKMHNAPFREASGIKKWEAKPSYGAENFALKYVRVVESLPSFDKDKSCFIKTILFLNRKFIYHWRNLHFWPTKFAFFWNFLKSTDWENNENTTKS